MDVKCREFKKLVYKICLLEFSDDEICQECEEVCVNSRAIVYKHFEMN